MMSLKRVMSHNVTFQGQDMILKLTKNNEDTTCTFMRLSKRTSFLTVLQTFPQIALTDEQVGSQPSIIAYHVGSKMMEWLKMLASHNFHYFFSQPLEL